MSHPVDALHVQLAKDIGRKLRGLRNAKGLSQRQLAAALFLRQYQISGWEQGKRLPTLDTLVILAGGLGVTASQLLDPDFGLEFDN